MDQLQWITCSSTGASARPGAEGLVDAPLAAVEFSKISGGIPITRCCAADQKQT
jgi:hypothetical protein